MENAPLLDVRHLVTAFGQSGPASVNDISFHIDRGEVVGLVGESGSGKSVTSLSVMGLLSGSGHVRNGEILFTGRDSATIDLARADERKMQTLRGNDLAMIFQEPMTSLNPVMRCGPQVVEALRAHRRMSIKEATGRVIELFAEVQLPEPKQAFYKFPHALSGGQKQRVMIAMAMCCSPSLLIADEPTTALDVTVQKTILSLMKNLQDRHHMGILFITHDLGVVAEIADRVIVMLKGQIVEQGKVKDVFANPSHPYTKGLLACRPPLHAHPERLPVVRDFLEGKTAVVHEQSAPPKRKERAASVLLEVRNLRTQFPQKRNLMGKPVTFTTAVDDVSFDVNVGETLGLVGESGCGKTTLGRSLLKLAPVTSGSVRYEGQEILPLSDRAFRPFRRDMQLIFQDPYSSLNPRMSIGEAISEPLRVHGIARGSREARDKAIDMLRSVGLDALHYRRYPHEFSGGQRQRICIARALITRPKFVICDESVSALDVSVQAQVLNLINDLKRDFGFTCIFISHDLGVVKYMSDRMMVMRGGRIEESGEPEDIYARPRSEYTRDLVNAIPQLALERLLRQGHSPPYSA